MSEVSYPELSLRVKALIADNLVIVGFMIVAYIVLSLFNYVPDVVRMSIYFGLLLYDPLLTSISGGTIGHRIFNLRVRKSTNTSKNIHLPAAIFRYLFKICLGTISLLSVRMNDERRAFHDYLSQSVVVNVPTKQSLKSA